MGIALGMVVRVGSSTGGMDVVCLVLHKWFHFPVSVLVWVTDFLVIGGQAIFAPAEDTLFGIVVLFLETFLIEQVMIVGKSKIQIMIFSKQYEEIRKKLSEFVEGGFDTGGTDPSIPGILQLLKGVTEWRQATKKGRKTYDDKSFVQSLADQFARRHSLSPRQTMALKRVAVVYRDQIPDYDAKAEALGLRNVPSSDDKQAEVIGV